MECSHRNMLLIAVEKKLSGACLPQNLESYCLEICHGPLCADLLAAEEKNQTLEKAASFSVSLVALFHYLLLAESDVNQLGKEKCSLQSPVHCH